MDDFKKLIGDTATNLNTIISLIVYMDEKQLFNDGGSTEEHAAILGGYLVQLTKTESALQRLHKAMPSAS